VYTYGLVLNYTYRYIYIYNCVRVCVCVCVRVCVCVCVNRYGLELKDEQRRAIKKLRGFDQYLIVYDQFCIKAFVERQKQVFVMTFVAVCCNTLQCRTAETGV